MHSINRKVWLWGIELFCDSTSHFRLYEIHPETTKLLLELLNTSVFLNTFISCFQSFLFTLLLLEYLLLQFFRHGELVSDINLISENGLKNCKPNNKAVYQIGLALIRLHLLYQLLAAIGVHRLLQAGSAIDVARFVEADSWIKLIFQEEHENQRVKETEKHDHSGQKICVKLSNFCCSRDHHNYE